MMQSGQILTFIPVLFVRPSEPSDHILEIIDTPVDMKSYTWVLISKSERNHKPAKEDWRGTRGDETIYCLIEGSNVTFYQAIAEFLRE